MFFFYLTEVVGSCFFSFAALSSNMFRRCCLADMVGWGSFSQVRASSKLQFGALREVWRHARGREHCRGEPGSALSGGNAPDSAKAEGSSIVDEPEEC